MGIVAGVSGREPFRWESGVGMQSLCFLPGVGPATVLVFDVSGDGSLVVGRVRTTPSEFTPFIWDEANGMRNLQFLLTNEFGLDLTGWNLEEASSISDNDRTIVGTGFNPNGNLEGWIAQLDSTTPIPEPSTMLLFGTGLAGLVAWRYRRGVAA